MATNGVECPQCDQMNTWWVHSEPGRDYWVCACGYEFTIDVVEVTDRQIEPMFS